MNKTSQAVGDNTRDRRTAPPQTRSGNRETKKRYLKKATTLPSDTNDDENQLYFSIAGSAEKPPNVVKHQAQFNRHMKTNRWRTLLKKLP